MTWTNPAWLLDLDREVSTKEAGMTCQAVVATNYDIRFSQSPIKSDGDFSRAIKIKFRELNEPTKSDSPWATLYKDAGREHRLTINFFMKTTPEAPKRLRSQFRERTKGYYAVRYYDMNQGWSPISNAISDNAVYTTEIHEFDARLGLSGGISNFVGTAVLFCDLKDPYAGDLRHYSINPTGLSIGGSIGATEPFDKSWVRFRPYMHMHLRNFDDLGVHIWSQGIALGRGVSRASLKIYESRKDALSENKDGLVAGPINFSWGLTRGLELNFLGKAVGTLDRIR
jgi:hypothetical protein